MENVNKPQLWNIFNQVTMHSQDVRHHRFCLRLMLKNPDNHALCVDVQLFQHHLLKDKVFPYQLLLKGTCLYVNVHLFLTIIINLPKNSGCRHFI